MTDGTNLAAATRPLLDEVAGVFAAMPADALDGLVEDIAAARRIALYGAGRTGLVLQALAMRLYHLGLDAHVVGAMNVPPIGAGDLFIVNAALGNLPTGLALLEVAKAAGARVVAITAVADSAAGRAADRVLVLPAQTMADDQGVAARSAMPMGSQYECALFLLAELLVLRLGERLGRDFAAMRARHTNLQ